VVRALATVPGRVLDAAPIAHGMSVDHDRDAQPYAATPRARLSMRRSGGTLLQLYVYGGFGDYRPYVLAEGIVTHIEGRSGIHRSIARSYVAPIAPTDGRVQWQHASQIDPERLDIRAVPDPHRRLEMAITPEALQQYAAQAQDAFKQFLEESERLQIFHNPAFNLYSEPAETRETFLQRCLDEARRQVEDQQERLESTFRRRFDQLREKSEREERDNDARDEGDRDNMQEVNVAWGQALYNITSGRPAAVADATVSVREVDYLEKIAQIQRAWDKELKALRDELDVKARAIEDMSIVPTEKNIEITRYLILWAASLP
jgi:hypothetical protein